MGCWNRKDDDYTLMLITELITFGGGSYGTTLLLQNLIMMNNGIKCNNEHEDMQTFPDEQEDIEENTGLTEEQIDN